MFGDADGTSTRGPEAHGRRPRRAISANSTALSTTLGPVSALTESVTANTAAPSAAKMPGPDLAVTTRSAVSPLMSAVSPFIASLAVFRDAL
jgi:hypothetical protein